MLQLLLLVPTFLAPPKWEIADPQVLSPQVKVGFLGASDNLLRPSLNLVVEETALTQDAYMAKAQAAYAGRKEFTFSDLGSFKTAAGEARLSSLDTKTPSGALRLLQLVLVQDGKAYVMTGSCAKEEFAKVSPHFEKAFRTFSLKDDLLADLAEKQRKEWDQELAKVKELWFADKEKNAVKHFQERSFQRGAWLPFQRFVLRAFEERGGYFQFQLLQRASNELFASEQLPG